MAPFAKTPHSCLCVTTSHFQTACILTVRSHRDESGGGEEEDEDHVDAEEKPAQRGQVQVPVGCVGVEGLVEESLKVGLPTEGPYRPQTPEGEDQVREDRASSWKGGKDSFIFIIHIYINN